MGFESHFEHIGPRVSFGDVAITTEQAEAFRQIALEGTRVRELSIGESASRILMTSYGSGVLASVAVNSGVDHDLSDSAFYSKTTSGTDPDYWRSVITFARFDNKEYEKKFYNIYEVETHQGEVMTAVRRVKVLRNLSRIAFDDDGEPYQDIYSRQRVAFEKPMLPDDIEKVQHKVKSVMGRVRATARR